ncbi:JAB domain-containing protein [Aestuariibacter sp. GS-14]|uniref:RadC family protein n=1 Tax=Aestuariibacter sp. GS-14 TaxID=2590670 RepID=UPI0011283622|nr:DNA repair protein RadC [Aestuariibacter sp. GS-14]TPV54755.1 JAB domain-containing protein [Aestuariibacter sp. GS-14]
MTLLKLPEQARPREKLLAQGVAQLSDIELLAILIRSGNQGLSALDIARCLLQTFGSLRGVMTASKAHLCKVNGIGETKYCEFQAALEVNRRQLAEPLHERSMFHSADDAKLFLRAQLRDLNQEVFAIMMLNSQHHLLAFRKMFTGTINAAAVYPRELVKQALTDNAAAVILVHNHPSGNPTPSQADIALTRDVKKAMDLVDIQVLDHFIVADNQVSSLAQQGLL